ncbi:MAG: endonuclease VIII [Elainellaceae cyanobacterium]
MPEGPEIRRAADAIAAAVVNQPIQDLFFAFDRLKPYAESLARQQITAVQTKGKAILLRFDHQLSIYSHNQLYGVWMIRRAYAFPDTKRQLRLAIHTAKKSALLYSASDIEVLTDHEIDHHPFLSKLGPDVLDANTTTIEQVSDRLLDAKFRRRRLGSLLLDQHFLCGLGNYLRSEVLFVAGLHPSHRPMDCPEDALYRLAEAAIALSRRSYETGGITNDLERAQHLKQQGHARRDYRHYVFARSGKPCYTCGTSIVKDMAGGRRYYACPTCQPVP